MNVGVLTYRCDRCGKEYRVRQIDRYYQFEGGALLVKRLPAWCDAEGRMVEAEAFGDLWSIERALELIQTELKNGGGDEVDPEEWRRRVRWRRARMSAPRCLECGSTDVHHAPDGSTSTVFRHPACGGVLSVRGLDLEDVDAGPVRYDSEGRRIE